MMHYLLTEITLIIDFGDLLQKVIMCFQFDLLQAVYIFQANNEISNAYLSPVMKTHFRLTIGETHNLYGTLIT